MARREFKSRYAGTLGGAAWAVLLPLSTVAVFWFVFAVVFKAQGPDNVPFILYYLTGFLPWFTFSEVVNQSAGSVTGNANLVKKTTFPTEVLPASLFLAALVGHVAFLAIVIAVAAILGYPPTWTTPLVAWHLLALAAFSVGLGWLVAALNVFQRDVSQALTVVLSIWFWLTPIVWFRDMIPASLLWAVDFNPMAYVVEGYRDTLLFNEPPWADPAAALAMWGAAFGLLALGATVFRKLKPEFADAL